MAPAGRASVFCGQWPWLLGPALLCLRAAALCDKASDHGKTVVLEMDFKNSDGSEVKAHILCGEDAAAAAGRICTARRTRTTEGNTVVELAHQLQQQLDAEAKLAQFNKKVGYKPPDLLDAGREQERPRVLTTLGQFSRRAFEHAKRKEFALAVADYARALLRLKEQKSHTSSSYARLLSSLTNQLNKAEEDRRSKTQDGDLTELFEDLELSDDGMDNKDVDLKTLKKVYRDLSVKYHPDKNEAAAKRFNRIRDAYEVLSDPMKTMLYDTGGLETVRKYEGGGGDLERTDGDERQMWVTLEDVYMGTARRMEHSRRIVCRSCRLYPEMPRCKKCTRCPGEKEMRVRWINQNQYMQEEHEIPSKEKCMYAKDDLELNIEKGMGVGERIHFPHMAHQLPKKIAGDFQVAIRIKDHHLFKRVGNDLIVTVQVSLFEALLGFQRELVHLDGHVVKFGMERGEVLKPGMGLEIEEEGMPFREDPTSFGRLIVQFQIEFPQGIPLSAADALESALRSTGQGPKQATVTKSIKPRRTEL